MILKYILIKDMVLQNNRRSDPKHRFLGHQSKLSITNEQQ